MNGNGTNASETSARTGATPRRVSGRSSRKGVKRGDAYAPRRTEKRARAALQSAEGIGDPQLDADRAALENALARLWSSAGEAIQAQNEEVAARAERDRTDAALKPSLEAAEWTARLTPHGRTYVRGCQGRTRVETAGRFMAGLPEGGFSVLPGQLDRIRAAYETAIAARDAHVRARAALAARGRAFVAARVELEAATQALKYSVKRLQATRRLAEAAALAARDSREAAPPTPVPSEPSLDSVGAPGSSRESPSDRVRTRGRAPLDRVDELLSRSSLLRRGWRHARGLGSGGRDELRRAEHLLEDASLGVVVS